MRGDAYEPLADGEARARCEARALVLGHALLLGQGDIAGLDALLDLARFVSGREWT